MTTQDFVDVVPGVRFPRRVTNEIAYAFPGSALDCSIVLEYDDSRHRFVCRELTVRADDVTTFDIRRLTMNWVYAVTLLVPEPKYVVLDNPDGQEPWGLAVPDGIGLHGPTDRALRWTAHIYRYGLAVGWGPTETVQELLDIPRSTAGRWISQARKAGYLGDPVKGKATV